MKTTEVENPSPRPSPSPSFFKKRHKAFFITETVKRLNPKRDFSEKSKLKVREDKFYKPFKSTPFSQGSNLCYET